MATTKEELVFIKTKLGELECDIQEIKPKLTEVHDFVVARKAIESLGKFFLSIIGLTGFILILSQVIKLFSGG